MKRSLIAIVTISIIAVSCSAPVTTTVAPAATEPPVAATIAPTIAPTDSPATEPVATKPPEPTATLDSYGDATATSAPPTDTPVPAATDTPAVPPTPATVYITYKDFEIVPRQVTIKVGTTVVFLIEAGLLVSHQPYNFTGVNQFEAPANLGNGTSWSYTFNEPGTVTVLCGYHAEMIGTVIVEP